MHLLYTLLVTLLSPAVYLVELLRSGRQRARERRGVIPPSAGPVLWIHAVSVGEVRAAAILLPRLRHEWPDLPVIMTTTTPTGARQVAQSFGESVRHVYLPLDVPRSVRRFLTRLQPRCGVIMETEIWPNLFHECARRRIPLVIASARLSEKSVRRFRPLHSVLRAVLGNVTVAAQTALDAERYCGVGVRPDKAHVTGNVKFDLEIGDAIRETGRQWRTEIGEMRPVWVAGSTRENEDEQVLEAHARVRETFSSALLVLVPRHPHRFGAVKGLLERSGIEHVTRSSGAAVTRQTAVLLVDTLGELLQFYAAADVAFVGGTLVPIGGHNLLEPAALGLPVLTGPHVFNAPDVARLLLAAGAAIEVHSGQELGAAATRLLGDPEDRSARGRAGIAVIGVNGGAVERTMAVVRSVIRDE